MRCRATTTIGRRLAEGAGFTSAAADWILEGGAIDVDGTGLASPPSNA